MNTTWILNIRTLKEKLSVTRTRKTSNFRGDGGAWKIASS
jgi:hypothetical protein